MSSHRRLPLIRGALLIAVVTAPAACGGDEAADASAGRYGDAYDALCEATDAAAESDTGAAERLFFDRAHQSLHELASNVAGADRAVAARLLEAKETAETALDGGEHSGDELARLATATRAAFQAIDHPTPASCPGEE